MKPSQTYTISSFINAGKNIDISYAKSSIQDNITDNKNLFLSINNVIYDYIDELNDNAIEVNLTEIEYNKYLYKPRLLAYDIYGYTDYYFLIMIMNNINNTKEFNFRKVKLIHPDNINIIGRILNAEEEYLNINKNYLKSK